MPKLFANSRILFTKKTLLDCKLEAVMVAKFEGIKKFFFIKIKTWKLRDRTGERKDAAGVDHLPTSKIC